MFRALELLANDKLLMSQLDNYIIDTDLFALAPRRHFTPQRTSNDYVCNQLLSALVGQFGGFFPIWSFSFGIFVGRSVYELVTKKHGETATGKALALAGLGCLMGITATGYILGKMLHFFLLITSRYTIGVWAVLSLMAILVTMPIFVIIAHHTSHLTAIIIFFCSPLNFSVVVLYLLAAFIIKTKQILLMALCPIYVCVIKLQENYDIQLITHHIPLLLLITDVFNLARWPIITLISPLPTSGEVLEGLFIGVLMSQLLMVALGMSLFVTFQRGGAGKICAGAVAPGLTVVGLIEAVLPVLGPCPTIGALMGVTGAVGVTLAAAGAVTDSYGTVIGRDGLVGRVGVTVGAAVGAFLSSSSHSGLSSIFMVLCAASIPIGLYLKPMFLFLLSDDRSWKLKLCLYAALVVFLVTWLHFTCTKIGVFCLIFLVIIGLFVTFLIVCLNSFSPNAT